MSDIDLKKLSEAIPIEQVDFRVQSISTSGWAILLAYKDARVDQDRLDAVVGKGNWERRHQLIDGQLFCRVGIWIESKDMFVWKEDVGTESTTEKEKGRASDAFKRACFNWGIGRELYDYPLILVELDEIEFRVQGDKAKATFKLQLKNWTWHSERTDPDSNGKTLIKTLKAVDQNGKLRFTYPRGQSQTQPSAADNSQSKPTSANTDNREWYDDYEQDKESIQNNINKGVSNQKIIDHLSTTYKLNKKTAAAIMALKPEVNKG